VVGATNDALEQSRRAVEGSYPSLAQIAGHALNSIFMDSMEVDLERVQTINDLVKMMPDEMRKMTGLKYVELLVIKPSESIDKIAERYMSELPWTIRVLLRLIGAAPRSGGSALISFLLSEKKYCRALMNWVIAMPCSSAKRSCTFWVSRSVRRASNECRGLRARTWQLLDILAMVIFIRARCWPGNSACRAPAY